MFELTDEVPLSDARDILSDISFETYSREQEILKPIIAKLREPPIM